MNKSILKIYSIASVFFIFMISTNMFSIFNQPTQKMGESSKIIKKEGIGFLILTAPITNSLQLLVPLSELLADDYVKVVVLKLDTYQINLRDAWTLITDFQRLRIAYGKPVIAYSESFLSGENYIAACGTDALVVSPLGKVGGIGCSWSEEYCFDKKKREGKLLHLIYSGKFKDISPELPPKTDHIKIFDHYIYESFNALAKDISSRRPNAGLNKDRWVQGEWFNTKEAITYGLIDAAADKIDLVGYAINFAGCAGLNLTNIDFFIKNQLGDSSFVHGSNHSDSKTGILKIDTLNSNHGWDYGQKLLELFKNHSINKIVLYISCDGGPSTIAESIHQDILKLKQLYRKPVVAYVDTALSGGYLIAIAADYIIAGRGALIGSVGSCCERWDFTQKDKNHQVKTVSFSSGKGIAVSNPYVPLSVENKNILQREVDRIHAKFIQDVKSWRPHIKTLDESKWTEAQIFTAQEALEMGLIDATGTPLDALYYGSGENDNKLNQLSFVFKSITPADNK